MTSDNSKQADGGSHVRHCHSCGHADHPRRQLTTASSCELWLNDDFVGSFPSADAAAQSVSHHSSGCELIDDSGTELPQSIDAWQWISVSSKAANQPVFLMRSATPARLTSFIALLTSRADGMKK